MLQQQLAAGEAGLMRRMTGLLESRALEVSSALNNLEQRTADKQAATRCITLNDSSGARGCHVHACQHDVVALLASSQACMWKTICGRLTVSNHCSCRHAVEASLSALLSTSLSKDAAAGERMAALEGSLASLAAAAARAQAALADATNKGALCGLTISTAKEGRQVVVPACHAVHCRLPVTNNSVCALSAARLPTPCIAQACPRLPQLCLRGTAQLRRARGS